MLIAAVRDDGYNVMLLLHILAVIVAFAPNFVWPFVSVRLKKAGKPVGPTIAELASSNSAKIYGPALALAGIFGFGLVGMSDQAYEFSEPWLSVAMLLWFVALGVVFGMMAPAEKRVAAGDAGAEKILSMAGGILHLVLFLELIMMIFKPGA
ncbi:MAG: hypothetical protein KDB04_13940 [Acidimicrobiales bacterium]|nr:hypothetical protein [Acidimicrobiales bacterium]